MNNTTAHNEVKLQIMIRPAILNDKNEMINLFDALNLFDTDEMKFMSELVDNFFNESLGEGHYWIVNDDNGITSAAYYAPESFGQNVYNLYFIGVSPNQQGNGIGSSMLKYVENHLKELGERLLLVETSGLPNFEKTREFYLKNNYEKEATIREYYKEGDDKIIFRKKLPKA
jgi:ribosomal protein S18 acetylase RimI-like enzyme